MTRFTQEAVELSCPPLLGPVGCIEGGEAKTPIGQGEEVGAPQVKELLQHLDRKSNGAMQCEAHKVSFRAEVPY